MPQRPRQALLFRLLIVVSLLSLVVMGYSLWRILAIETVEPSGAILDSPAPMGDVELTAAGGIDRSLGDWPDKFLLVFFGFTSCPDVCPLTMARLARIYESLGEPEDLQVVMVTVDPANDTPDEVQAYAETYHPAFIGLGGTSGEVAAAAKRFFVGYSSSGNDVNHTDAVFLLDTQARMRIIYTQSNLDVLEGDLREVLSGKLL